MTGKPDFQMWYCKSNKATGDPIIIKDMKTGETRSTDLVMFKNVDIVMGFNNATSNAKRSGATTVLEIYKNE